MHPLEHAMADLSKKPLIRLLEAINLYNPKANLSLQNVAISSPEVVVNNNLHNTKVIITAIQGSILLKNKRTVYYNRLNLQSVFTAMAVTDINTGTATDTHELLPLILQQTNVLLEPIDIVLEPISSPPFILTATPNSHGWIGSVSFGHAVTDSITVHTLDDGSTFGLDNNGILELDETVEI